MSPYLYPPEEQGSPVRVTMAMFSLYTALEGTSQRTTLPTAVLLLRAWMLGTLPINGSVYRAVPAQFTILASSIIQFNPLSEHFRASGLILGKKNGGFPLEKH